MASCVGITRIRFKGSGPRLALSQPGKPSSPVIGKIIAQAFIKCNTIPVQKRRSKAGPAQSIWRITAPAVRSKTKPDPSAAGPVWRGGAMDRADDISFAIGIKRRRSKADFAPTWSEWRDLNSRPHGPEPCALPSALHPVDSFHIICVLSPLVKKYFSKMYKLSSGQI